MKVNHDCRFFRGDIPCHYHKKQGVECSTCPYYSPIEGRILIIKLGAAGDVIRTTPILRKLRQEFPQAEITWLTDSPDLVPSQWVDRIWKFDFKRALALQSMQFDLLINLDKDLEACALAEQISAAEKRGYGLSQFNRCRPINAASEAKYLTGIFDTVNKANTKSYPEEIFEMCGYVFQGEKYILSNFADDNYAWRIDEPFPRVGLNTGCGKRWTSRLWPTENWINLAVELKKRGFGVVILGGPDEHEKNKHIAEASGSTYPGIFPFRQFINLVDQCDLMVTAVTMAMHIAIGLEKKLVLFNNIFNRHEFELYGLGEILEPAVECDCFFANECPNNCMEHIYVDAVLQSCQNLLKK
ncbi:MAG: glycosyltransferase family 9 protein [Candidatus Zhuqueibacterota bacterium]